jgi:hypothetical protein
MGGIYLAHLHGVAHLKRRASAAVDAWDGHLYIFENGLEEFSYAEWEESRDLQKTLLTIISESQSPRDLIGFRNICAGLCDH